jgi:hypothetical protein
MNSYSCRPESDGMLRGGGGDEEALMQVNCVGVGGGGGEGL